MTRCAFVIDQSLPRGLIANTAAILAMTLGRDRPELVGHAVQDADGVRHEGITRIVMPILTADADRLMTLKRLAGPHAASGLGLIDVTEAAQRAKDYQAYEVRIGSMRHDDLRYLGLCLHGPGALVRSLTGDLPLLR